jgi:hypothetical protein
MTRPFASVTRVVAACLAGIPARAETDIRSERVQFQANTSGASISARIKDREIVDYLLGAWAGQTLSISMQIHNGANYFNVIPPDADDEAVFIGSTKVNSYEGKLDLDSDWNRNRTILSLPSPCLSRVRSVATSESGRGRQASETLLAVSFIPSGYET